MDEFAVLRSALARRRRQGTVFEAAWADAIELLEPRRGGRCEVGLARWAAEETIAAWRDAYERRPPESRHDAAALLADQLAAQLAWPPFGGQLVA